MTQLTSSVIFWRQLRWFLPAIRLGPMEQWPLSLRDSCLFQTMAPLPVTLHLLHWSHLLFSCLCRSFTYSFHSFHPALHTSCRYQWWHLCVCVFVRTRSTGSIHGHTVLLYNSHTKRPHEASRETVCLWTCCFIPIYQQRQCSWSLTNREIPYMHTHTYHHNTEVVILILMLNTNASTQTRGVT